MASKLKLAGVTKMLGALKARGNETLGLSPASSALQPAAAAAPQQQRTSATRTPSRERFSTPGSMGGYSDDDTKSFNRSQMSVGRNSLGTVLPDGDRVFDQGGFGSRGVSPDIPQLPIPQPQKKQSTSSSSGGAGGAGRKMSGDGAAPQPQQRRTPARQPPQDSKPNLDVPPPESARSNRSDVTRSTPPTAAAAAGAAPRLQPRKEDRYQADTTRQAEPSRKEQLRDGKEGRRSAPRRDSPTDGRSSSRMRDAASKVSAANTVANSMSTSSRTPRGKEDAPTRSSTTPNSRQLQTPERSRSSQPRSTTSNKDRVSPPNVDVATKTTAAAPQPAPAVATRSKPVSPEKAADPSSPMLGGSQRGGVAIRRKVTNAVAAANALSKSTGSKTPVNTGPGERLGVSRTSPAPKPNLSSPPGFNSSSSASPGNFSLANFIQETSSQYDFNRAPSRMSMGGSQYGGSDSGVSTPVHMRGASLMDAVAEAKYPSKLPPSSTAGVVDLNWIDGTTKVTTAHGIETSEQQARLRIRHAGLFRPKVWFFNEILPGMRQSMLREFAMYKRRAFVECAEPQFRQVVFTSYVFELRNCRLQFDENLDRLELERATVLWRSQVKNAFDRLVQQLMVEKKRKTEEVKLTVEQELVKNAHALTEKTSFSYLHLHQQFGEMLLKRTKELYVFYFGIFASMNLKEEKERAAIASEQRFLRHNIEMERVRFFILHLESVEYENIMKYFNGEKRILENELRFKPKPRNTAVPALNHSQNSAAGAANGGFGIRSALGAPLHAPGSSVNSAAPTPMSYAGNNNIHSTSATPYRQTPASTLRYENDRARKDNQSPFPLDALEKQMPARRQQQLQHEALQQREMESVRATPVMWNSPPPSKNPPPPAAPEQHQFPQSYQQANPLAYLKEREKQEDMAAAQAMLQRMPAPAMMSNLERRAGSQAYDRLGRAMQWDDGRSSVSATPIESSRRALSNRTPMGTEDRRRFDDESDAPLPPPVRGGGSTHPLLPKLDHYPSQPQRKAAAAAPSAAAGGNTREVSEGVINGLLLVSNVMNTPSANDVGGRLPPIQYAPSVGNTQAVVSSIGRALLGSNNSNSSAYPSYHNGSNGVLPAIAAASVPSFEVDERQVAQTEIDTAVALLLLLHKSGADAIASAELGVRQSVAIHEQEHRRVAAEAAMVSRSNRFLGTRLAKLLVEEEEDRHELFLQQRHEFGLHVQRQQWVEYFLMTTDESAERERIVGMSHLSLAIVGRNAKKEFGMTCLMQHQVLVLQQLHQYQRWYLSDIEHPTSAGLHIDQNERRERNRLINLFQRETKLMEEDEKRYNRRRDLQKTQPSPLKQVSALGLESEALSSVEEVHRRNIARQFTESLQRLTFELKEEGMARAVLVLARQRWFNDLVRPSQHRAGLTVSEQHQRDNFTKQFRAERQTALVEGLSQLVENCFSELVAWEARERRRISLYYLKERRQREAVERSYQCKQENMERYVQQQHGGYSGSPQGKNPVLGEALNKYFAATAVTDRGATPSIPDYTSVIKKVKQQQQMLNHA